MNISSESHKSYQPDFSGESWNEKDRRYLEPFATNPDGLVTVLRNLPPELVGALCSRASRAKSYLLRVFLDEYIYPIADGPDKDLAGELETVVDFLRNHGFRNILNNQRAQGFYAKWLAQYGDDSIAQMTGTHLVFWGISQVAMKFIEDQRIGLEPIEKSTRYVNFTAKIGGKYLYYTPAPDLERLALKEEYRAVCDKLFDTYSELLGRTQAWLKKNFNEKDSVIEKKAFDTLRGLLPSSTLGQAAFRGNAQALEYMINRLIKHELGEFRWIAQAAASELKKEIPSLLLRLDDEKTRHYQDYLAYRRKNAARSAQELARAKNFSVIEPIASAQVKLVDYDPELQEKIIAAILFSSSGNHSGWETVLGAARALGAQEKKKMFASYFDGRMERWHKVGRALENSHLRFEIVMNIGAYRDLHRHRMLTQDRQLFSAHHGYDLPKEVVEAGLENDFCAALERIKPLFYKLERENPALAQYVVPLAYRLRFYQYQNIRSFFWSSELRTIAQGHPDYRCIEQEKYRLFKEKFPLLAEFMLVDMNDYAFARRGDEARMEQKENKIITGLNKEVKH